MLMHWLGRQFSATQALAFFLQYCFFFWKYAHFLHMRSFIFPTPLGRRKRIKAFFHLLPWWIMLSTFHWWGLFIYSCTSLTQGNLDSELKNIHGAFCPKTGLFRNQVCLRWKTDEIRWQQPSVCTGSHKNTHILFKLILIDLNVIRHINSLYTAVVYYDAEPINALHMPSVISVQHFFP